MDTDKFRSCFNLVLPKWQQGMTRMLQETIKS
ncbi:hypothetical protein [Oceanisphaera sp. IT1-181]|nr:hypothetical protein [Oceanisphaera sp. IT1-181]